ncbi:MAG: ATP-binding cassette domain-containing protein [Pseudomonadota bacterium]
MLKVQNLQFKRGAQTLFDDLSFTVHDGQCVAIAGRNGVGKSTLFQLILRHLQADTGDIDYPTAWRIASMAQEVNVTERGALDFVIDGHAELRQVEAALEASVDNAGSAELHMRYQDLDGYSAAARAGEILHGLGFAGSDFDKPYAAFSGGWRIRLNLARTLMTPADLLLLDEPTNHLDMETILWLEQWLRRFEGTALLIAHDRTFLDNCADHTLYLSNQRGTLYRGNYSAAERARAEALVLEEAQTAKRAAKAAHIQQFVDRFRAKASKAKQVQSRIKALEKLQAEPATMIESPYRIEFSNPQKVSNPLFSWRDATLGYEATPILKGVSHTILPGDRIGVLGANGAGKSTLLKSLVGELTPMQGELLAGTHAQVGYFAQHQLETLESQDTALATLTRRRPAWREQQVRDYLGGWGFDAGMLERPIATLSGGEKARFVLAMLAIEEPAVLVLDEPTNHLDLDMRDALIIALGMFEGAVIIVSHDRNLLEKSVDDLWLIEGGALTRFEGDLADYSAQATQQPGTGSASGPSHKRREQRQQRAVARAQTQALKKQIRSIESKTDKQRAELSEIESRLADKYTYDTLPAEELDNLLRNAGKLRRSVEALEEEWLNLSEELENAADD